MHQSTKKLTDASTLEDYLPKTEAKKGSAFNIRFKNKKTGKNNREWLDSLASFVIEARLLGWSCLDFDQRLDLAFVQDYSEWFVTFWTVEKPDFKLHLLAAFIRSTSHCPFLFW